MSMVFLIGSCCAHSVNASRKRAHEVSPEKRDCAGQEEPETVSLAGEVRVGLRTCLQQPPSRLPKILF